MSDYGDFFRQALGANDNRPQTTAGSNVVYNGPVTINITLGTFKKSTITNIWGGAA